MQMRTKYTHKLSKVMVNFSIVRKIYKVCKNKSVMLMGIYTILSRSWLSLTFLLISGREAERNLLLVPALTTRLDRNEDLLFITEEFIVFFIQNN